MHMGRNQIAVFCLLALSPAALAQSTWTGSVSSAWDNPGNWMPNVVPLATGQAAIIAPAANNPSINGVASPSCAGLTVQTGATLDLNAGNTLLVSGSVAMSGSTTGTGAIRLTGSGTVTTTGASVMPQTEFVNTGGYTINATFGGNVAHFAPGASLTIQSAVFQGAVHFLAAPFVGAPNATMDVAGACEVRTTSPTTNPPATITLHSQWVSDASWQPAAGRVICSGLGGVVLTIAPNTHWQGLESEAHGANLNGDLYVNGGLRLRSDLSVSGTTIELGAVAGISFPSRLIGPNVTLLRIHNGMQSAGSVLTPNAVLDADGDMNFFVSGTLQVGPGTHHVSNSFAIAGTGQFPAASTIVFDGSGNISTNETLCVLPNVQVTGTNYTILRGVVQGNLQLAPGAGNLNVLSCTVNGNCDFHGNAVLNFLAGSLTANGAVTWQTSSVVTNPPATITCRGTWTSDASFGPTSGLVVLDGTGAQLVNMTAFHWHDLRIGTNAIVSTPLATLVDASLEVRGSLTCTGPTVTVTGLLKVPGSMQAGLATSFLAHGSLDISGTVSANAAAFDVDGDAVVSGTLSVGPGGHVFSNSVKVSGAFSVPAGQTVTFDGSGEINIATSSAMPSVFFSGSDYDVVQLRVAQNLTQTSGAMNVQLCQVVGNALLQGDAVLDLSNGLLDVGGNVNWQTNSPVNTPPSTIQCGGNWTSTASFQPTSGLVFFDGTGPQGVSMPVFQWFNLRIGAGSSVSTAQNAATLGFLDVLGSLTCTGSSIQVGGVLTIASSAALVAVNATSITFSGTATLTGALNAPAAVLTASQAFVVNASGFCALGNGTHQFSANFTQNGTLAVPATATFAFTGSGTILATPAYPLPQATFSGGDYTVMVLAVAGALTQTAGRMFIQNVHALSSATFQGNTIADSSGGQLTVDGALSLQTVGSVVTPPTTIRCGGAFSANAQFAPTFGVVIMQGASPQVMNAPLLTLSALTIQSGAQVSFGTNNVILLADLIVNGSLQAPTGSLEIRGSLTVAGSGALALQPTSNCTCAQNCTNAGTISGTSALTMVGTGTMSGAGAFPRVTINAISEVSTNGALAFGGQLALSAGSLRLLNGSVVTVTGNLQGTGGTLRGGAGSQLVLSGSVTLDGVAASPLGVPDIQCAGNWTARSTYQPTNGTVTFSGAGQIASLGGTLTFFDVQVQTGARSLPADLAATAHTVAIAAAGQLQLGTRHLDLTANTVTVNGTLSMGPSSRLLLGTGTAVTVPSGGLLQIVGSWDNPAVVDGPPGGAYALSVSGGLEAMDFEFHHMGPNGIVVNSTATIAAVPHDLRGGLFADGDATAGACLLRIDRTSTTELRYLRFVNAPATATFNVQSSGAGNVNFVNQGGAFSGAAFENDPGNVVNWLPPQHTVVTGFSATAAVHRTELTFTTTSEIDVQAFHLQRSLSGAGPFVDAFAPIAGVGGPGTGGTYARTDLAVTDTTKYFYRAEEILLHGEPRNFGTDFARPWPQSIGNTLFVGTNGGYTDIAAAVAAAVPGQNIVVQAGTYPAFTITQPVRIMPDGSGPVNIDTTLAKFVIQNIPAGSLDMSITGLHVGSAVSPFGMEILNCGNTIVVQDLTVTTAGSTIALKIDATDHTAIQNSTFSGGSPGLRVQNNSLIYLSRSTSNAVDVQSGSTVTLCEVTPGSLTSAPGTTVNQLAGVMPNLTMKPVWAGEKGVPFTVTAPSGTFFAVVFSLRRDFVDLSPVFPIDMVLLVDHTLLSTAMSGLSAGTFSSTITAPGVVVGWGQSLPLQMLTLDAVATGRMGTSLDVVFVP
jgi:hypothetical protein